MKNEQKYQNTNSTQLVRELKHSGSHITQHGRIRNSLSPYPRTTEIKILPRNHQQYRGQQLVSQNNDSFSENHYKTVSMKQINYQSQTSLPLGVQSNNYKNLDIQEKKFYVNRQNQPNHLLEKDRSISSNGVGYQQISTNTHINNALKNNGIITKSIPNQLNVQSNASVSQPTTNQPSKNTQSTLQDLDNEYNEALKKLKKNEEKIKILLERQQIDGKINDAKERIERLKRILNLQEKVSLSFINRFINATNTKIRDENLCKSVIDAFDNVVRDGNKYKSFQIPHYDPLHKLKEKFLRMPDFDKCNSLEDLDNSILRSLENSKENDISIINETSKEEENNKNILDGIKKYLQSEIVHELDERTKLITGKDGKDHLMILCKNNIYLVLSETITKDLKLSGKFKIDPQNIPITNDCCEVNVIITFDRNDIPPLHLLIPIDYPKNVCSIVNPNYCSEITDLSLNRLISRVEQALPCLSVYRRIQNIAITWMNLAMNGY
uniref:RWD domain-containing protein n=2 Tax=Strongyloides stercoralis TaxID=6248 RepID=A0A0K0EEY1_STRER